MLSLAQHAKLHQIKKQSLDIPRHEMPQIFTKNMDDFKKFLFDTQVSYFDQDIHPSHLTATQNQFNSDKIERLMTNPTDAPIITSQDKYVVDGHHRFLAALLGGEPHVKCIEIQLPIKELLSVLHTYDKVGYKSVNECKSLKVSQ